MKSPEKLCTKSGLLGKFYTKSDLVSTKSDQVELLADHALEVPGEAEREVHRPARRDPAVFQGGVDLLL